MSRLVDFVNYTRASIRDVHTYARTYTREWAVYLECASIIQAAVVSRSAQRYMRLSRGWWYFYRRGDASARGCG